MHNMKAKKRANRVPVTVSGLSVEAVEFLRQRAKNSNRSLSGEIRDILLAWVRQEQGVREAA
jgi:plasmid stability protein